MDLPSELLLNIAEYEPKSQLGIDPHEIVRRITVVNPKFDLEQHLLHLLELANKQAKAAKTTAYKLYCYLKHKVYEYQVVYVDKDWTTRLPLVRVICYNRDGVDKKILNEIFGIDVKASSFDCPTHSNLSRKRTVFQLGNLRFLSLYDDTLAVMEAYGVAHEQNIGDVKTIYLTF